MTRQHDMIIIGSGPGGYIAALRAAQLGAKVAVVEKDHLGGTCLNRGCIPSKALLTAAELMHSFKHAGKNWGITCTGEIAFDWSRIQKHKDRVLRQNRAGIKNLFKGRRVEVIEGAAAFEGPGRLVVTPGKGDPVRLESDRIILATGTEPARIPGWPEDPKLVCTSDEAVHWSDVPRRLMIVGGGVIGCEFACMMAPFGVEVTIVEMMPALLPGLDHELGSGLAKIFKDRGITCHTNVKVENLQTGKAGLTATLSSGTSLEVDRVLVATGRRANAHSLHLDAAGIGTNDRGFIAVDETMQTNVPGHYCIGDANGRCLLAHAASAHGVAAAENALGESRPFDKPIPSAVYTFPEIGAVGLTEQEADERGIPVSIGRFPLSHLGKAMASQHTEGFVKVLRHRETDELLGVHMLGHNATEVIAAAATMLHHKATTHDLAEVVFAHPTISEAVRESAEDALGMGLHLPPRKVISAEAVMG